MLLYQIQCIRPPKARASQSEVWIRWIQICPCYFGLERNHTDSLRAYLCANGREIYAMWDLISASTGYWSHSHSWLCAGATETWGNACTLSSSCEPRGAGTGMESLSSGRSWLWASPRLRRPLKSCSPWMSGKHHPLLTVPTHRTLGASQIQMGHWASWSPRGCWRSLETGTGSLGTGLQWQDRCPELRPLTAARPASLCCREGEKERWWRQPQCVNSEQGTCSCCPEVIWPNAGGHFVNCCQHENVFSASEQSSNHLPSSLYSTV